MWQLRHPEGAVLCRLSIEVHAESRTRGWQQVPVLPLGLHRDDVGQESSRFVNSTYSTYEKRVLVARA